MAVRYRYMLVNTYLGQLILKKIGQPEGRGRVIEQAMVSGRVHRILLHGHSWAWTLFCNGQRCSCVVLYVDLHG